MFARLLAAGLTALLLALHGFAAHAAGRVALVIGIGSYRQAPSLRNPVHDAGDLSQALQELGFEVVLLTDAGKSPLDMAIRTFARQVAGADVGLVFFAGHGVQVAGQNYLLPADARFENARDLELDAIRLDLLLGLLENGRDGKVSIVLLDACRDNPLTRNLARAAGVRSDAYPRGLAAVQSGAGSFIAFATAPGKVAYDGQGRNSPFTAALLRHIRTANRGLNALMIEVRKDVMAATGNAQVPWDHSALLQDFQFRPATGLVTGSLPSDPTSADDVRRQERARRLEEELSRRPP
ncbi:MAG TPA: caspase family protein [Hyphomicrobiaceae bacterium]|nr:caspase family protein [Hyphomicrobiaceae bacterium]